MPIHQQNSLKICEVQRTNTLYKRCMSLLQTFTNANANKSDHLNTVTFMDHQAIKCPALTNQEINTDIVHLICLFLPSINSVK